MKKSTLKKCEEKLLKMKSEILNSQKEKAKEKLSIDTNVQDEGDIAQDATQKSVDLLLLEKEKQKLNMINHALKKIEEGTYGICIDTEEEIEESRLLANPLSLRSLIAQENFEKIQQQKLLARKPAISSMYGSDD